MQECYHSQPVASVNTDNSTREVEYELTTLGDLDGDVGSRISKMSMLYTSVAKKVIFPLQFSILRGTSVICHFNSDLHPPPPKKKPHQKTPCHSTKNQCRHDEFEKVLSHRVDFRGGHPHSVMSSSPPARSVLSICLKFLSRCRLGLISISHNCNYREGVWGRLIRALTSLTA